VVINHNKWTRTCFIYLGLESVQLSKLLFHGPYSLSKARFLPCQTLL
jgi:hypothetical protein